MVEWEVRGAVLSPVGSLLLRHWDLHKMTRRESNKAKGGIQVPGNGEYVSSCRAWREREGWLSPARLIFCLKKEKKRDLWVAQWFGACLWPRA